MRFTLDRHAGLCLLLLLTTAPASAQEVVAPRAVGNYAGVEPGESQPPPAYRRVTGRRATRSLILTWPGFSPLGDGGSRFFVQTVQPMQPEVRVEQGRVVLLFRNTTIHVRNSARWLETQFFNTPVRRARLERRGRDMALVLYLRPGVMVQPRVSTEVAAGGTFHYVYVDFPRGDYAPVAAPPSAEVRPSEDQPPPAPARELDPTLDSMDDERPPGM